MRSRVVTAPAARNGGSESPGWFSNGQPVPPKVVLEHLSNPANRPPPGSPERRDLVGNIEEFVRILEVRGDPLEEPFRVLLSCVRDGLDEEDEGPAEGDPGRRVEVPISTLNENDLLTGIPDPTWKLEDRRRMAAELSIRESARLISPANREAARRILIAFGNGVESTDGG